MGLLGLVWSLSTEGGVKGGRRPTQWTIDAGRHKRSASHHGMSPAAAGARSKSDAHASPSYVPRRTRRRRRTTLDELAGASAKAPP
jgi:hypothetical protein